MKKEKKETGEGKREKQGGVERRKKKKKIGGGAGEKALRAGRQRNWKTGRKRNRQRGVEKKEPSKDRRGRKEKGAKGQEEAAEGFPKLRTLPRELRGAPWLPNITPGSWSSTVHLSCWRRHPPLRAPSRQLPLPVFHPPVVQGTPFLSLTPRSLPLSLFSFPVPSYLSPPCTLLASELQAASPTTTLTIIVLNRPIQLIFEIVPILIHVT